eukprot:m.36009 g.36009  ORF g.36009 m.36009 type:complete len:55 (+) comp44404_c0_seq1:1-165(+)
MSLCMTMKAFWQKRGVCCMLITMKVDEFTPKVCAGSSEKNEALFSLFTRPNSAF